MAETMTVTKRCPRHGAVLVYDTTRKVWKCPIPGCYYAIPADQPEETADQ